MNKKALLRFELSIFSIFALLLIMTIIMVVFTPQRANAETTLNVPTTEYPTIASAVAAASSGDTIKIAAGTYTETLDITINKSLTIEGAKAGIKGSDNSRGAGETIINFTAVNSTTEAKEFKIGANDIKFDGLTIGLMGQIDITKNGTTVTNCIFDIDSNLVGKRAGNIFTLAPAISGDTLQGFTFTNNCVKNTIANNILYIGGKKVNNLKFNNNKIENKTVYSGGSGVQGYSIFLDGPTSGFPLLTNVEVKGNTVTGGAKRSFNMTSMSDFKIQNNYVEGKYYAFMVGGMNGDISNNTCVAKVADPASESDVYAVSYGFMFSLSVFDQAVQLTNVGFYDNTIYYGVYHDTNYNNARNYAVLFSISKSGVISDITKVTPLVEDFQMYNNNFVNEADETITYFPIQWTVQNSYSAFQKILDAHDNNYYWGTSNSHPDTWTHMRWYAVYNKLKNCQYDWQITFDANGGQFDKTIDISQYQYDINTPQKIDNPRSAWSFDPGPDKQLGYARALNDGDRNSSAVLPYATSSKSALAGSIAPVDIPVPTKVNNRFVGWFTDKELTHEWDPTSYYVTTDSSIYAKFENPTTYTVKYLEKGTNKELSPPAIKDGIVDDTVNASDEAVDIVTYRYNSANQDSMVLVDDPADNELILYYTKIPTSYTVNYLEKDTNKVIHSSSTKSSVVGKTIYSASEVIDIYGYNYGGTDKNSIVLKENINDNIITLYYTKASTEYTVNFLEKGTDKVLHSPVKKNGFVNETIYSSNEIMGISGYAYDSADHQSIILKADTRENIITLYYTSTETSYRVIFLEKGTNEVVHSPVNKHGTIGMTVYASNEVIDISGYKYDSANHKKIVLKPNPYDIDPNINLIKLYYTKKSEPYIPDIPPNTPPVDVIPVYHDDPPDITSDYAKGEEHQKDKLKKDKSVIEKREPGKKDPTYVGGRVPTAGEVFARILKGDIPLDAPYASWALLNLIMIILGGILAIIMAIVTIWRKFKERNNDNKNQKRVRPFWLMIGVIIEIVAVIVFILTEDITLPMVWTDIWTFIMIVFFVAEVIFMALVTKKKKEE